MRSGRGFSVCDCGVEAAVVMAGLHAAAVDEPWRAEDFRALLAQSTGLGFLAQDDKGAPAGFALARVAADEAELLQIAVHPGVRRRGLGAMLLRAVIGGATSRAAGTLFLEVSEENGPALSLYTRIGFMTHGVRRGYYRTAGAEPRDGLLMSRVLSATSNF